MNSGHGAMTRVCSVRRSYRSRTSPPWVGVPEYTTSGSPCLTAMCPHSELPTRSHSLHSIAPLMERPGTLTAVLSCCVP